MKICSHLAELERRLIAQGFREIYRRNYDTTEFRLWVWFDCFIPLAETRAQLSLPDCVEEMEHIGTHDGQEAGFVCSVHHDGVMGHHRLSGARAPTFDPALTQGPS